MMTTFIASIKINSERTVEATRDTCIKCLKGNELIKSFQGTWELSKKDLEKLKETTRIEYSSFFLDFSCEVGLLKLSDTGLSFLGKGLWDGDVSWFLGESLELAKFTIVPVTVSDDPYVLPGEDGIGYEEYKRRQAKHIFWEKNYLEQVENLENGLISLKDYQRIVRSTEFHTDEEIIASYIQRRLAFDTSGSWKTQYKSTPIPNTSDAALGLENDFSEMYVKVFFTGIMPTYQQISEVQYDKEKLKAILATIDPDSPDSYNGSEWDE